MFIATVSVRVLKWKCENGDVARIIQGCLSGVRGVATAAVSAGCIASDALTPSAARDLIGGARK